jgi:hypothetical protein
VLVVLVVLAVPVVHVVPANQQPQLF